MAYPVGEEDHNLKFAVPLNDGMTVESVFYGSGTLCISSQAGCALECPFCACGKKGFFRNLHFSEMVYQLDAASRLGCRFQRITLSGIGEPLLNWDNVKVFLTYCSKQGYPVSLTTVGRPLQTLREALTMGHNGVMVSLHAGTPETHRQLIPGGPDFNDLLEVLSGCRQELSRRRRRRLGINYLLLEGINDREEEIENLALLMKNIPEATLHILECNPLDDLSFKSPGKESRQKIFEYLISRHPNVRRGNRWRKLAEGGCGTLMISPLVDGCHQP